MGGLPKSIALVRTNNTAIGVLVRGRAGRSLRTGVDPGFDIAKTST